MVDKAWMSSSVEQVDSENETISFAERATKKRKVQTGSKLTFLDLRFLLPTSNLCERFFSKAGYGLSDQRRGLLPANFESQIFLNANMDYWGVSDINSILNEPKEISFKKE